MNLRPDLVRQCIANLLLSHPELFDDEEARALSIESETPAVDYLRSLERRRQEAEAMAGALAAQIAQLELRQERFVRQEKGCREIAFKIMNEGALTKLVMPEATYSIRAGQQKLMGDVSPEDMSPEYTRIKVELNREAIKQDLKAGKTVTGFTLSNAEPTLSIRTK